MMCTLGDESHDQDSEGSQMSQKKKSHSGKTPIFKRTMEEKKSYIENKYALPTDKTERSNLHKTKL